MSATPHLFDYFVCPRALIHEYADALQAGDRARQSELQGKMARRVRLKMLGPDEVNVLARCFQAGAGDVVETVTTVELIRALDEQRGPWIMGFAKTSIELLAHMDVDDALVARWLKLVGVLAGGKEEKYRKTLTVEAAHSIRDLCATALEQQLGVFTCSQS